MLKVEKLNKAFNKKPILKNISFEVDKGEIAVFLGESGVGKSTLLRVLNDLERADSGVVFLDGEKLDLSIANKEKHIIGMVFQQFNLFEHMTAEQNITLVLEKVLKKSKSEAKQIAQELLKQYGLENKAERYIFQLSGGQKQRLAIARTIALKPQIICLDEPTSALDPLLTTYVAHNIQELAKERYIVLVASHDISLLEKLECTIYLMKNNEIVESARSSDFFHNKEDYPLINAFVTG